MVDKDLYSKQFAKGLLRADIYDCMDIDGNRFLLISTYPLSGELTSWRESVLDAIDHARGSWIKMGKVVDGYGFQIMDNIKHKPRWPKQVIDEFVLDAFGGNIITADNLPVSLAGNKPEYHNRRY